MTTLTFDTLAYAKRLRDAGMPESQAEAQAAALADALRQSTSDLVTKQDLAVAVADLKADLLKWVIGLFIAQVGLFAALVKLLH
jgi:hypothetical protein